MKKINNFYKYFFLLFFVIACEEELRDTSFTDAITAPTNVAAAYDITQDNTGLVTITPSAEGASSFEIHFGDGTADPAVLTQGENIQHVYDEGTYDVRIVASSINGKTTEATQQLVVSFKAPENLVVVIENDAAISKQVNVTANAEFATIFEFNSGETGVTQPVVTGNIGNTVSYQYANPGTYSMSVTAKGAAIATTTFDVDFEVTEILAPIVSAPTPPTKNDSDVISIYTSAYTNVSGTNFFPDWGQGGQGSSWAEFNLNGDTMLQYINLSYQGIALQDGTSIDVSGMEYLHLDVWTSANGDITDLETSLINNASGVVTEAPVTSSLTAGEWTSIEIPISDYTNQGLTVSEIFQLKFVGTPWATGTVFIDNIYFYKQPSSTVTSTIEDFEGTAPTFTVFGNIAPIEVIANPDATGANTSAQVAKMTKTAGSEVWAGSFFDISTPLDVANFPKMTVKTWSPKAGATVRLKIENQANNQEFFEIDATTTVANSWEELTFDLSTAQAFTYDRIVIFFDFGNAGDDSEYYYDEFNLVDDSGSGVSIFQDFEGTAPTFTVFGNIADVEVIDNPDATGANTTGKVVKMIKTAGSEVWAGSFFDIDPALDLANFSTMSIKTWSPKVGATVRLKIENQANNQEFFEIDATTTVANSWEELTFDLSNAQPFTYNRVVIFFDFGNSGDDSVYYYDEFGLTN